MQFGDFLIPFTKPSSPVLWIRPYQNLSIEAKGDGKVTTKIAVKSPSIDLIRRSLLLALGLSFLLGSMGFAVFNVLAITGESEEDKDPCEFSSSSESIEFDDVGILCLDYQDRWSMSSFEDDEGHFRYQNEWGGFEEHRWSQTGDVVTLCDVDQEYDTYYCLNLIRVQGTSMDRNLSHYSFYNGVSQNMPSWVEEKPSSVSVNYQSSTDAPFGNDRLLLAWDDEPGWESLEVRGYGVSSKNIDHYMAPLERGIIEIVFPYMLPMLIGFCILAFTRARFTLIEFDSRQSQIQRRLNIGTPLSKFDWVNVDFQKFTLEEHNFTITHRSSSEDGSSRTTYSHHEGLNLSCVHEGGTHVLFFIENKNNTIRKDLVDHLFSALDLESPLDGRIMPMAHSSPTPLEGQIRPPLVSSTPEEETKPLANEADSEVDSTNETGTFWDSV
jgi:hypothetical protein